MADPTPSVDLAIRRLRKARAAANRAAAAHARRVVAAEQAVVDALVARDAAA